MDIANKSTGDSMTAAEQNQVTNEIENSISSTGQTPSSGDVFQLGKTIANYAANGDFYTDSGAASAYVLSVIGSNQAPTAYGNGLRARFIVGNDNTGASTVNINSLGVKNITIGGVALGASKMVAGDIATIVYDLSNDRFELESAIKAGSQVGYASVMDGEVATGTTLMVKDNSIPQNTEGDEYMTLVYTPTKATNKLEIAIVFNARHSSSSAQAIFAALFQDSTADALAAGSGSKAAVANTVAAVIFTHTMIAGTASSTTFKVRAGANVAGTTTFNGESSVRQFGGVYASSIIIKEIEV